MFKVEIFPEVQELVGGHHRSSALTPSANALSQLGDKPLHTLCPTKSESNDFKAMAGLSCVEELAGRFHCDETTGSTQARELGFQVPRGIQLLGCWVHSERRPPAPRASHTQVWQGGPRPSSSCPLLPFCRTDLCAELVGRCLPC